MDYFYMKKILVLLTIVFAITGCVRKMSIEQGNILTPEKAKQVHAGMTPDEVKAIMGTPILMNTFNNNRVDYVYTFQPGGKPMTEKYVTYVFENNHLVDMKGNL